MIFAANGDRIEFTYENGVVSGKATIKGNLCDNFNLSIINDNKK